MDREAGTKAIGVAQVAAQSDDIAAAAAVRLARRAGPDAVRFLCFVVRDDDVTIFQRVRAAISLLEVGGLLGGGSAAELRLSAALREGVAGGGVPRDAA